jgi:hypothetical protein
MVQAQVVYSNSEARRQAGPSCGSKELGPRVDLNLPREPQLPRQWAHWGRQRPLPLPRRAGIPWYPGLMSTRVAVGTDFRNELVGHSSPVAVAAVRANGSPLAKHQDP